MAAQLVTVTSNYPGASTLTLVDGTTATGYNLLNDPQPEFGNVVWQTAFSGPRGTQGARPSHGVPENRALVFALLVEGTSKDDAASKISTLQEAADQLRRFGGKVKWRSKNQSYAQYFEVMSGSCEVTPMNVQGEALNQPTVMFSASCAPYLLGDSYDIADDFSSDTLATDYTFDAGSGTLSVSGGATRSVRHNAKEPLPLGAGLHLFGCSNDDQGCNGSDGSRRWRPRSDHSPPRCEQLPMGRRRRWRIAADS